MHAINKWKILVPVYAWQNSLLKKHHLFDKLNQQKSHLFLECACDRHVEVLSTLVRLKYTACARNCHVEVLSTTLRLKDACFEKTSLFYHLSTLKNTIF